MKGKIAVIRILIILLSAALLLGGVCYFVQEYQIQSQSALSQMGSRGTEVTAIQEKLKEYGLYNGNIDGIYGSATREAVIRYHSRPRHLKESGHQRRHHSHGHRKQRLSIGPNHLCRGPRGNL